MTTRTSTEYRYLKGGKVVHTGFVGSEAEAYGLVLHHVQLRHGKIDQIQERTTTTTVHIGDWHVGQD